MSDEVSTEKENTAVEKESTAVCIQTIPFEAFKVFTSKVSYCDYVLTFNLPEKAEKYCDDPVKFIQLLVDYQHEDNENHWRVKRENKCKFEIKEDCIMIGNKKLIDYKICSGIPLFNGFIIVPGEKSCSEGSFSPAECIQIGNMICTKPSVLRLTATKDEADETKFKFSCGYEFITPKEPS